jgi:hypothetical protein
MLEIRANAIKGLKQKNPSQWVVPSTTRELNFNRKRQESLVTNPLTPLG